MPLVPAPAPTPSPINSTVTPPPTGENPEKSYLVALLISYLVGSFGVDRFYLGKIGTGVAKLLTFGGLGVWAIVDLLLIAFGKLRAKDDTRPLEGFAKNYSWVKLLTVALIILNVVVILGFVMLMAFSTISGVQDKSGY